MATTSKVKLVLQWTVCMLVPWIFLLIGTCTVYWLDSGHDHFTVGLFGQKMDRDQMQWFNWQPDIKYIGVLDDGVVALIILACVMQGVALVSVNTTIRKYGPDSLNLIDNEEYTRCYKFSKVFFHVGIACYVLSSILTMAGCIMFSEKFSVQYVGVSWYMCLGSALYIWLVICVFVVDSIFKGRRATSVFHTLLCEIYH